MAEKEKNFDKLVGEALSEEMVFEMNTKWLQGSNLGLSHRRTIQSRSISRRDEDYGIRTQTGKYGLKELDWR